MTPSVPGSDPGLDLWAEELPTALTELTADSLSDAVSFRSGTFTSAGCFGTWGCVSSCGSTFGTGSSASSYSG